MSCSHKGIFLSSLNTHVHLAQLQTYNYLFPSHYFLLNLLKQAGRLANEAKELSGSSWGEKSIGTEAERSVKLAAVEKLVPPST